jgi:diguanylate cyclase (GGDEF)-like protein/PAS domain S-box-containing protein
MKLKFSVALRIAATYAVVAALWIGLSDKLLYSLMDGSSLLPEAEILKGWAFVAVTSVLLYLLVRKAVLGLLVRDFKLGAIVNHSPSALSLKHLDGRYALANPNLQRLHHKPEAQILGKTDVDLYGPELAQRMRFEDEQVLKTLQRRSIEEVIPVDGVPRHFISHLFPVVDEDGAARFVGRISLDITDRKLAEAKLQASEAFAHGVLNVLPTSIAVVNPQGEIVAVNAIWRQFALDNGGDAALAGVGVNYLRVCEDGDMPVAGHGAQAAQGLRAVLAGQAENFRLDYTCQLPNGLRWFNMRVVPLANRALGAVVAHTDITARKLDEARLLLDATVFTHSYEGIMIADARQVIVDVNPAFTRITGYGRDEILGQTPRILSSGRQDAEFYAQMKVSLRQHDMWHGEIWNRRKNGEIYAEMLAISVVRDSSGEVTHYIGIFSDISHIKAHQVELDHIAHYDTLTGVPNRRLLSDRLERATVHSRRDGRPLAVCYLDLDGFKPINDTHGHVAGDQLLLTITRRLTTVLRADDTLARLGGDEFVLLLTGLAHLDEVHIIMERVMAAIRAPVAIGPGSVAVTASIGVAVQSPDDTLDDADTLLRHADQAMYRAKEAGKNRYVLFDPAQDRKVQEHRDYLQSLHAAFARREFVMHYQPKVDLVSGAVVGAEALIRWQHPQRGLISPGEFLPHLNGSDLEVAVGEWVFECVLQQLSLWRVAGLDNIIVSANVNASHLLSKGFTERLGELLARYPGVRPGSFELEILETSALDDMQQSMVVLTRCRLLGVRFALDDFGTGYSSLTYFRNLPLDILKIDQSFVRGMLADSDDRSIVETVIRLAAIFKRSVIAEGVETTEHGEMLVRLGCHLAQGYGIARPMPAELFPGWAGQWPLESASRFDPARFS